MNLAVNIRRLRLERQLTQAALAEAVGVSDRAISRWERRISCPDVTLLPALALALDTSADALLGIDPQRSQADILRATEESTALLRAGQPEEAVALLREKSALYPNQPELMVYLARALLALKSEEASREALALCRAVDGREMRLSSIFGCKQAVATALHRLGKPEQAAQLIEDEMPAFWVCRELLLPRVAPEERALLLRRSNVTLFAGLLTDTLERIARDTADDSFREASGRIRAEVERLM